MMVLEEKSRVHHNSLNSSSADHHCGSAYQHLYTVQRVWLKLNYILQQSFIFRQTQVDTVKILLFIYYYAKHIFIFINTATWFYSTGRIGL